VPDLSKTETPAETAERLLHGSSFGAAASAYAEHRPGYAEAAVRWALSPPGDDPPGTPRLGGLPAPPEPPGPPGTPAKGGLPVPPFTPLAPLSPPWRVVDLGAGTGKLTETLVRLGVQVTAVEPDPGMLRELRRELPSVRSLTGSAEDIPLPDGSADAILAGQSLHWFDLGRAVPEIARVLVHGGVLAALWNVDDDRVPWVAELAEISKHTSSVTLTRWRDRAGQVRQDRMAKAGSGLFGIGQTAEFEHGQRRTAESLLATIATHSRLLVMDEPDRTALLTQISEFLHARPETSAGEFVLPLVTAVLRIPRT
jgi:SAM-dependent methyltransferase